MSFGNRNDKIVLVMSAKRIINAITVVSILVIFLWPSLAVSSKVLSAGGEFEETVNPVAQSIERQLRRSRRVAGATLYSRPLMRTFYTARQFEPVWRNGERSTAQVQALKRVIEGLKANGLNPDLYHGEKIDDVLASLDNYQGQKLTDALADLDLLLTDTFFLIGVHFSSGLINPYLNRMVMFRMPPRANLAALLERALDEKNVQQALEGLLPRIGGYAELARELKRMRQLAQQGGWPRVPKVKKIEPGAVDQRVVAIRRRLEVTGELAASPGGGDPTSGEVYDEELVLAVKQFQRRHGLIPDGIVGRGTIAALNVPAKKRVCQLITNMDRIRARSRVFEEPSYIVVNVPAFEAMVFENGERILDMKAIVGRLDRQTPVISKKVRYLVFSPKWRVPKTIAVEDKLPIIQKDPSYLKRKGMTLFAEEGEEVDPYLVDWSQVNTEDFPYHIVQAPGRGNALGRVKFMFPNRHSVYLHDTPSKYLFKRQVRTFSSGCIRINKPVELAEHLLRDKEGWDRRRIRAAMNRDKVLYVDLPEPVPIHLTYLTAWVDGEGNVVYYNDIYKRGRAYKRRLCRD